jgi:hypothetical protein
MHRIFELKETLRAILKDNSWLSAAPAPDQLITECTDLEPSDTEIKDNGMRFSPDCTGYGDNILNKSITAHYVNRTHVSTSPKVIRVSNGSGSGSHLRLDNTEWYRPSLSNGQNCSTPDGYRSLPTC